MTPGSNPESSGPPDTGDYFRLQLPSHPRYVAMARDLAYRFCREHDLPAQLAFELKIVCGEAFSNIIKHAYDGRSDKPVFLEVFRRPNFIEMRIRDVGAQRPIGANLARDLGDYREKGLGLFLIDKLSDYHYFDQSLSAGTQLIVKKRIPESAIKKPGPRR